MRLTKRILASVLMFAVAFTVLGGLPTAHAVVPGIPDTFTVRKLTPHSLNNLVTTADPVTWSIVTSGADAYLTLDTATGRLTAYKNTTSPIQLLATSTVANGDGTYDTKTMDVTVAIPVSLAFTSTVVDIVKGAKISMPTQLTTAEPDKTHLTWSVLSGPGKINATSGELTVTGAGDIRVRATSTINGASAETTVRGIVPKITLAASVSTITTIGGKSTVTATLTDNGSQTVTDGTSVNWTSSDPSIAKVLTSATTFSSKTTSVQVEAVKNGSVTITAASAADNTIVATIRIGVGTATRLELTGPDLNKNSRYGTYTVRKVDAAGNVIDDDTSDVHWDWSSGYLSLANDSLNDSRGKMHNGEAHIKLYARGNTKSGGTRLYVWLGSSSDDKVYHTINITGLSSLPQTGQDLTLVYVFGGLCAAMLIAAGVVYGIRKKKQNAA